MERGRTVSFSSRPASYIFEIMKDVSAFRPRHWLLLIAGLSFVVILVIGFYSYSVLPGSTADPSMPGLIIALPSAVTISCWLAMGVSLTVYCAQWVVTLITVIMAQYRSAST